MKKKKYQRANLKYEDVYKLYIIDNLTQSQCAEILNCTISNVGNFIKRHKIKKSIEKILERKRLNCLEKYGVENWMQTPEYREMFSQIWDNKTDDEIREITKKREKTSLKRYGVRNNFQTVNWEEKYGEGITSPFCLQEVRDKAAKSLFDHFGVINAYESPTVKKNNRYICDGNIFDSFPELALWMYAKDHNEEIYRDHKIVGRFIYYYKGKKHYYYPDFLYKGELVEIKGLQFFKPDGTMYNPYDDTVEKAEQSEEKHKCMLDNNVKIWILDDYAFAIDYFNANYNKLDFKLEVS